MDSIVARRRQSCREQFSEFSTYLRVLVLIDESGDCGLKFDEGSSDLLVCAAVVFADAVSAEACDEAISGLKCKLQRSPGFEFHVSRCSDRVRELFLRTVSCQTFQYVGLAVDKRRLYGARFTDPKEVYRFSVGIVCEQIRPLLNNSKIVIDKNGDGCRERLVQTWPNKK